MEQEIFFDKYYTYNLLFVHEQFYVFLPLKAMETSFDIIHTCTLSLSFQQKGHEIFAYVYSENQNL